MCPLYIDNEAPRPPGIRRGGWTPEQDFALHQLYVNGTPVATIAGRLNKTVKAVLSRADRLRVHRVVPETR